MRSSRSCPKASLSASSDASALAAWNTKRRSASDRLHTRHVHRRGRWRSAANLRGERRRGRGSDDNGRCCAGSCFESKLHSHQGDAFAVSSLEEEVEESFVAISPTTFAWPSSHRATTFNVLAPSERPRAVWFVTASKTMSTNDLRVAPTSSPLFSTFGDSAAAASVEGVVLSAFSIGHLITRCV